MLYFSLQRQQLITLLLSALFTPYIFSEGFVAGTLVKTPQGHVPIENLHSGDAVMCCTQEGVVTTRPITNVTINWIDQPIAIITQDQCMVTGPEQALFLTSKHGWTRANNIAAGDSMLSISRTTVPAKAVYPLERPVITYALSIKDYHNFFISQDDILVHNMLIIPVITAPIVPSLAITTIKAVASAGVFVSCIYSMLCGSAKSANTAQQDASVREQRKTENGGPCRCGHLCGPSCQCMCSCGCAVRNQDQNSRQQHQIRVVENILNGTQPGRETKGRTKQFTKYGNFDTAYADFASLNPKDIRDIRGGKLGLLEDGRTVNVRMDSSYGEPTLEIYNPFTESSLKIRYITR